jgi:hypothetical protein
VETRRRDGWKLIQYFSLFPPFLFARVRHIFLFSFSSFGSAKSLRVFPFGLSMNPCGGVIFSSAHERNQTNEQQPKGRENKILLCVWVMSSVPTSSPVSLHSNGLLKMPGVSVCLQLQGGDVKVKFKSVTGASHFFKERKKK